MVADLTVVYNRNNPIKFLIVIYNCVRSTMLELKNCQSLSNPHIPGDPIVLTNVHDILFAEAAASSLSYKALATASYAIANVAETEH